MSQSRIHLWLLPAVLLVQRGLLWWRHGADFDALLRANPHWITVQLQSVDVLRDQPVAALWYLQQTPPVPNALVAALLQGLSWPVGVGWALVLVQALCSLALALLLVDVGRRLLPYWASLSLGVLWLAGPDVVVLETVGLAQVVYENLAALGVLACVWTLLRWLESERLAWSVSFGTALGVLALTRSSYGFFSLYLLALLALALWVARRRLSVGRWRRAARHLATCAAVALLIQGSWSLKNQLVFGHWTWPASTWGGASLAASLASPLAAPGPSGQIAAGDELTAWILEHRAEVEPWFANFVEDQAADGHGIQPWSAGWSGVGGCPLAARRHDHRVAEILGGGNRSENTQCVRRVSEAYGDAATTFLLRRPGLVARKLKLGYATYWFPIRYHGGQYLSLFAVDWRVERPLRPWRSARQLASGDLPEPASVFAGAWPDLERRPTGLFTLDLPATAWWLLEVAVLHGATPLVVLWILWRLVRNRSETSRQDLLVLVLAAVFVYAAVVHNVVELGENMRFRWNVEPVIWLLVADSILRLGSALRSLAQRSSTR